MDECIGLLMVKSVPQSDGSTEVVGAHIHTLVTSVDRLAQCLVLIR